MTASPVHVLKLGGSALGDGDRFARIVEIVRRERQAGPVAVVVSAFARDTDELIAAIDQAARGDLAAALARIEAANEAAAGAAHAAVARHGGGGADLRPVVRAAMTPVRDLLAAIAATGDCSPATRDRVLAFGELASAALVAQVFTACGIDASPVDARTWTVTDAQHGDAGVLWEETAARIAALSPAWSGSGRVAVHTGFIGATSSGKTTTLGRNGSDYTASLLARGLGARAVTIWTDVSGVMTADPDIVHDAYPVPALSYREVLELAGLGLKMLHPRTMLPLLAAGIPMFIRNVLRPDDPGTRVDAIGSTDEARPTCVVSLEDMALVDVEGTQRSAASRLGPRVLAALGAAAIPVWFAALAQNGNGVALVVDRHEVARATGAIEEELAREIARGDLARPGVHHDVTLLTLVAEAMGRTVNVAGRFFGAIGAIGVNVRASAQGATSRAISCVVDATDTTVAVRAVHAAFAFTDAQINILLLGKGTVGRELLAQVATERDKLRGGHDIDVRVAGLVGRAAGVFDPRGLDADQAIALLESARGTRDVIDLLDDLKRLPVPVLVDCTAADGMEKIYEAAFARGVHVVAANKKPFALPAPGYRALFAASRRAHRALRYETTVGASLPVIETLKNLVRTGDRVRRIEGSLSGTLGFLANEVSRGEPLSRAVRVARERGYTEPHPREDLSGTDVARKALILARELGLELELEDVAVEPFVPREALAQDDVETFLDELARHDAAFEARIEALRADGLVLRYLATIEPPVAAGAKASVRAAPVAVPADHPAAGLRGTEALVAFRTDRYSEYPLVVRGSGAGGAVTAAGVLADVLALGQTLRGR